MYELGSEFGPIESTGLELARAQLILRAIKDNRDFKLVGALGKGPPGARTSEVLIVDVETHGVLPHSESGIRFRERLALRVASDRMRLVEALPLRRDFPVLPHQNAEPLGQPISLCLYFERPVSVLRTWTPERFLRRIQWWLEASSSDKLHATDQPVEQLFFTTRYELVLPHDFDELSTNTEQRFHLVASPDRPDGGATFFLVPDNVKKLDKVPRLAYVPLVTPPVVHGSIERDPQSLGGLSDTFARRGVDILDVARRELKDHVGPKGADLKEDNFGVVLTVRTPLTRSPGAPIERVQTKAFLMASGLLRLGTAIGAFIELDGRVFSAAGLLNKTVSPEWRGLELLPVEVLRMSSAAQARAQSGIPEDGPRGVLIGAGSLGGAILGLWGRSGWGLWTVVDNDHIKPHNLVRHGAHHSQIGQMKARVAADLHWSATGRENECTVINGDGCDVASEPLCSALKSAALVVDASTTLDYPRYISRFEGVGRHVSIFMTPDGQSSVMLMEDSERTARLRTLEAQYYRAILNEEWGGSHIRTNQRSFWSGASCRDISVVLPYTAVILHAAVLAEQVPKYLRQDQAAIRVWTRHGPDGSVASHEVSVHSEAKMNFESLDVFIDEGLSRKLRALRKISLPSETGGVLLGYHDLNENFVMIVDALPAPADSDGAPGHFARGTQGLSECVAEASRRTAGIVGYIGEWHSHPRGHSAKPSQNDLSQIAYLVQEMAAEGLPAFQLIVGEGDFSILAGRLG